MIEQHEHAAERLVLAWLYATNEREQCPGGPAKINLKSSGKKIPRKSKTQNKK